MRRIGILILAVAGQGVIGGCCSCGSSTGWRFEVGRPATVSTNGLVQQMSGPLTALPLGSTIPPLMQNASLEQSPVRALARTCTESAPMPARLSMRATPDDCTWEEICRLLRSIDQRLPGPRGAAGKQLPPGNPEPE